MTVTSKMLMEIVLVGCSPTCWVPLATFVVGNYQLWNLNIDYQERKERKKVNQALAITIKTSASLFYVATSFTFP